MKKRIFYGFVIAACLLLVLPVTASAAGELQVTGGVLDTDYTYADGILTILTGTPLTISGSTTTDKVAVAAGVHANITLNNVSIVHPDCAFAIADNSTGDVTVTLVGNNALQSNGNNCAGLQKNGLGEDVGTLTIVGEGSLTATGGQDGAGIGGGENHGSNITISGGAVTAVGGYRAAGIGGGNFGDGVNITISGGTVMATGGGWAAGIGGGNGDGSGGIGGCGNTITISGGTVTATGGEYAAGIGRGRWGYGDVSNISISGGTVTATGVNSAAGIGGGLGRDGSNVSITGDARVFSRGDIANGAGDIGGGSSSTSHGTLSVSGSAAVFLYNGTGPDEGNVTCADGHTLSASMSYASSIYGITPPENWSGATSIGAYLRLVTLDYNINDGEGTVPLPQQQHIETNFTLQTDGSLFHAHYTFSWNTQANGSGADYAPGDSVALTTDTTLYAKWTPVSYSISYDLAGGTASGGNPGSYTIESPPTTLSNPTKTGYTFAGWTGTDLSEPTISVTISTGSSGSREYAARWTANDYTVTFDGEGVTADPASKQVTYASAYGALPTPTRAGFAFAGWWTGDNGTGAQVTAEHTVATAENHTLYAKWTPKAVPSITLTAQSHIYDGSEKAFAITGTPSTGYTVEYYVGAAWTETPPTNAGRYNVRITRAEDATYAAYASGELTNRLIILAAVTYYDAEGNPHTVNADPVTSETTALNQALTQWYVAEGDVTISSTLTVTGSVNLILADGATLTVNGSSNSPGVNVSSGNSLTIYGQENGTGSLSATGGNGGAGIGSASGLGNTCGNVIINGGNVLALGEGRGAGIGGGYNAHGGNVIINGGTVYARGYGAGIGGGKSGYTSEPGGDGGTVTITGGTVTAVSWDAGAGIGGGGGTSGVVNSGDGATVTISGNAVVYARGKNLKDIGSGVSDGTLSISDTAAVFLYSGTGPAGVPCPSGHALSSTMNGAASLCGVALPSDWSSAENIRAYLRLVTLTYDANAGDGTIPALQQHIGTAGTIQAGSGFSNSGYNFDGWNTQADGDGTAYDPGDGFTFNAATTLYARWVPEEYTITYTLNGGAMSVTNPTSYTVEDEFTLNNPPKTGYTFTGWTSAGYPTPTTTVTVGPGTIGNLSFTANWTANTYTMTFDPEGGTVSTASKPVTYDSACGTLPVPVKAGFTFAGWWTGDNGTGTQITAANTVTTADNHTLYAKWTDKTVVSIVQTAQSNTYDGTAKAFTITGTPDTGFTVTYNQGGGSLSPVNPGSYNVEITRAEDETYAAFSITIENGLVIHAVTVDLAAISGVTPPVRGAAPVSAITETVQYTGAVTWAPAVSGNFAASAEYTATITLSPKTGYTVTGVTENFFTVTGSTSVSNAADSGVITAVFPATGAAPSSGGGGTGPATTSPPANIAADVNSGGATNSTLPVTVDTDNGIALIDVGSEGFAQSGTTITIPSIPDVDAYTIGISVPALSAAEKQSSLTVKTDNGSLTVPSNMLAGTAGVSGSKAEISIGQGDKSTLPDDVKSSIDDKPLVSLTLSVDGVQTDWSNPNAPVTVSIPYTPTAEELANPESIVVWYIDGSGNVFTIPNGHYDAVAGTVIFSTTHFSDYAVAYYPVSFTDVADTAWYAPAVSFIAAREITSGTGNGSTYSPEAKLTRGEFIVLMMRAYGIEPDENPTDNFADADDTYYTGYLAAAKRLGITAGVGENKYAPAAQITRQEMFTLLYNALKVIGQLPMGDSGKTVLDFSDAAQISAWAQEAMTLLVETGTVGGNNGMLTPTGTTTRAEMAQVLYNLLGK